MPPLQPGQRLEAWVLGRLSPTQVILEVGGRRLVADSTLSLQPGNHLKLEVVRGNGPTPHLKILARTSPPAQLAAHALRTALPQQEPLSQAFRSLQELVTRPENRKRLPQPVFDRLVSLLDSLPRRTDLGQADTLKTALRQSGLLHESLQAASSTPATANTQSRDLKTQLFQLAAVIRSLKTETRASTPTSDPARRLARPTGIRPPMVPDMTSTPPLSSDIRSSAPSATVSVAVPEKVSAGGSKTTVPTKDGREITPGQSPARFQDDPTEAVGRKVSAAIARIVLDQLASLPKADSPTLTWHFELPFSNGKGLDSLHLTIQGEPQRGHESSQNAPWSVVVEMDPPGLGKIQVRLVLQEEQISTYFWSESERTRALFEQHLETLARNFRSRGLRPDRLETLEGIPAATPRPLPDHPLLDEST